MVVNLKENVNAITLQSAKEVEATLPPPEAKDVKEKVDFAKWNIKEKLEKMKEEVRKK